MRKVLLLIGIGLFLLFHQACNKTDDSLLVEAESFAQKGGWVVDPQFVEQMGSPYLLAHGMGKPVGNAITRVRFGSPGRYHVWVRTKNWAPGDWDAPGRFRIIVNGVEVPEDLGTKMKSGWEWQYAGSVEVEDVNAKLELLDLTGFEGRCDAVYFSKRKKSPPNPQGELASWRKEIHKNKHGEAEVLFYDLVVVGGGLAGCAASIAAAEQGLKVALVHDRPVLGGNASGEIRVHTEGTPWKYDRIIKMLNTVHWPNGSPDAVYDDQKRTANMEQYDNISIFYNWRAFHAESEEDSILWVDARHTSTNEVKRFKAPLYVDCTGDGWIGYWAGAEYMYGREAADRCDESVDTFAHPFHVHFQKETLSHNWPDYKHLWSPKAPDNRVMGSSVLWRSFVADSATLFPEVPWAMEVAGNHAAVNGEWYWEFSSNAHHQIHDAEAIRDHMFKAIYGSFYNAKQIDKNFYHALEWVSYLLGKRESRRLVGDHIFTFKDAVEMTRFEDAVAREVRNVDVHYQQNLLDTEIPDFISDALYYRSKEYFIPYRSLYSKNIKNLFMAGRNFSCSHVGLGGPRVMHTTTQMGCAVGYAASVCHKHEALPRAVYEEYLQELLLLIEESIEG